MPLELTHLLLLMLCYYYPPVKDSWDSHYVIHNSIFPKDYSSFITMAQRLFHFTIYITHLGTMLWNGLIITTDPNKWKLTCTLTSSTRAKNVSQRILRRGSRLKFSSKVDFSHTAPLLKRYFTQTKQEHYYEILLAQRDPFVLIMRKKMMCFYCFSVQG